MRVSLGTQAENVIAQLHRSAARMEEKQQRISTGKRLNAPSDDPVGIARSLNLRTGLAKIEQFKSNSNVASTLLSAAEVSLTTISDCLKEIEQIALASANSTTEPESLRAYAKQLEGIELRILDAVNAKELDRYIFAGNDSVSRPFIKTEGLPNPYGYAGDSGVLMIQIQTGIKIEATIPGDRITNIGGAVDPDKPDIFTMIKELRESILNGTPDNVSAHLENIRFHAENILQNRAELGAKMQRIETMLNVSEDASARLKTLLSEIEDVDFAQAIVELKTQENVYQAALAVAAKLSQFSLVDWLR